LWSGGAGIPYKFLEIAYDGTDFPSVYFGSPDGAYGQWIFETTYINSNISFYTGSTIDFTGCTITDWGSNTVEVVAVWG
jgi:hypothetical protein